MTSGCRFDIRHPLEEACQAVEAELQGRARLIKDLSPTPLVTASEGRLRQLFANLLRNAAQAVLEAEDGIREIRVSTKTSASGEVLVHVADSGPAIPAASFPRAFEPFFTLRPAGTTAGFALATCENIVLAHGGSISLESATGRGTTFHVALPASSARPSPPIQAQPARRGRVLVIDDELAVTDSIKRVLGRDHDVMVALRATDALEEIARGRDFDRTLAAT